MPVPRVAEALSSAPPRSLPGRLVLAATEDSVQDDATQLVLAPH